MTNSTLQLIGRIDKATCDISQKKDVECVLVERPGFPMQKIHINEFLKFMRIVLSPVDAPSHVGATELSSTRSSGESIGISKQNGIAIGDSRTMSVSKSSSQSTSESKKHNQSN